MKLGCFGSSKDLVSIKKAGYDCAELDFCEITDMSDTQFTTFYKECTASGLGFEVFSGLIPLTERFFFKDFSLDFWLEHTEKGARRVSELGCNMIPFGAGKCRSIPEPVSLQDGSSHIAEIITAFSNLLGNYHIQLVIEPLGPANSNFLNTLPEVHDFLPSVKSQNCSSMCDLRHMHKTGESLENIITYHSIIKHAHIDFPRGDLRYFPDPTDEYPYADYIDKLKESNYDRILTVEATAVKKEFFTEAKVCCEYLQRLIN